MIRLNLLRNRFHSAPAATEPETLGSMSTLSFQTVPSRGRRIFAIAATVVLLGAIGAGVWFYSHQDVEDVAIVPPTPTATPAPDPAPAQAKPATDSVVKSSSDSVRLASSKDSARKADSAKKAPVKVADAPKPPPPPPPPAPKAPPKPAPAPVAVSVTPPVVAPALAGGVVNQVLSEAQGKGASGASPTRFEDLSAGLRVSYQRFAFERLLSVVRQVAAPTIRFSKVKLYSPGLLVLQGTADTVALRALVQGLLAQSLVDTALRNGPGGEFALAARLPFSASFGGSPATSPDFAKSLLQARDLAASQSLELVAPRTPSVQKLAATQRASWKLTGTGAWDSIDRWLSALQSVNCPVGFTSLALASGPDGKLRLEAEAISYSR